MQSAGQSDSVATASQALSDAGKIFIGGSRGGRAFQAHAPLFWTRGRRGPIEK